MCFLIDDILTRDKHIDPLISRLNSTCYAIRTVKGLLSRKVLRILQFSYVHPVILYSTIVWGNTPIDI